MDLEFQTFKKLSESVYDTWVTQYLNGVKPPLLYEPKEHTLERIHQTLSGTFLSIEMGLPRIFRKNKTAYLKLTREGASISGKWYENSSCDTQGVNIVDDLESLITHESGLVGEIQSKEGNEIAKVIIGYIFNSTLKTNSFETVRKSIDGAVLKWYPPAGSMNPLKTEG